MLRTRGLLILTLLAISWALASAGSAFAGGASQMTGPVAVASPRQFAYDDYPYGYDGPRPRGEESPAPRQVPIRGYDDRSHPSQPRLSVLLRVLAAKAGARSGDDVAQTAARIHGNSANSPAPAYLYRLETQTGEYLKTGVSQNPFSRYPRTFLQDKEMIILQQGSRRQMLNLERFIVERDPGLLNREPWAGRFFYDVPGGP